MQSIDEIPSKFLTACPGLAPTWQEHIEFWAGDERGQYNDAGAIAHYIVDCYSRSKYDEIQAAFKIIESLITEGDETARGLAIAGYLEDIQNISSHRSFSSKVFEQWLGPKSRNAWDELNEAWSKIPSSQPLQFTISSSEHGELAKLENQFKKLVEQIDRITPDSKPRIRWYQFWKR